MLPGRQSDLQYSPAACQAQTARKKARPERSVLYPAADTRGACAPHRRRLKC